MNTRALIEIRPLEVSDAQTLFADLQDSRLYTFIDEEPPESLRELEERYLFLHQGAPSDSPETWLNWVIIDSNDQRPAGTLQATIDNDSRRASIAYVLFYEWWGSGIASDALKWLMDELYDRFDVDELQVEIHTENTRSIRLAERVGFVDVEVRREAGHDERILRHRRRV